jgi:hypothetical protein
MSRSGKLAREKAIKAACSAESRAQFFSYTAVVTASSLCRRA